MIKDQFRCSGCHSILKRIGETSQYYCDQPATKCIESLKTKVIST